MRIVPILVIAGIMLGGIAAYYYWQRDAARLDAVKAEVPHVLTRSVTPDTSSAPSVRQELAVPKPVRPLPLLAYSDSSLFNSLTKILNDEILMALFFNEHMIPHMVATIDNLTGTRAPLRVMPMRSPPGSFIATTENGQLIMSTENEKRYALYVQLAAVADPKKVVDLYVHLYPLFQEAYEKLGYPDGYFNDRLMVVLDDLLAAPDIQEPIRLVQPEGYYRFADADLERRSIGQKILMRSGTKHEAALKTWLGRVRLEVQSHMSQQTLH